MTGQDEHPLLQHSLLWFLFLPHHKKISAKVHPFHFQRGFLGVLTWQLNLMSTVI